MNFDQWTHAISREVTAFNDNGPKVSNRFLEAYENELNEEEENAISNSKAKTNRRDLSSLRGGR
jgi:uncharacterized protein YeaO (DUF488 family)